MTDQTSYKKAFRYLLILFFMWGFITELDGALIPYLKDLFDLSNFQAALVQFSFFISFFLVSLPSAWLLNKIGYKKGIVTGLAVMGLGSLLFYPSSLAHSYPIFLIAIFVLASGVTLLQVAANPFAARLGEPETASARLNLSQGFNSIAKVIAPVFGSYFILRGIENLSIEEKAEAVQMPYIFLGSVLILLSIVFLFIDLPEVISSKEDADRNDDSVSNEKSSAWQFPHLVQGAVAIFFYVGVEVTISTFLVLFLCEPDIGNMTKAEAARYLSFYWGGLMVGRLLGPYLLKFISAPRMLVAASAACILLIVLVTTSSGQMAMWSLICTGLFHSIMWANIFTLSIDGLGRYTSQGSGILVASIVGGAIIPPIQGWLSDQATISLQDSFAIAFICYAWLIHFGMKGYKKKC